ncbi:magnesium transporter NIPA-domain-containing protein [Melampsora americana]|nr:magnesium transporter NIPA-domain-containing protein [Melampsora americana]
MTSPTTASLIGVAISICGNVGISVALNLQKLAHQRLQTSSNQDNSSQLPAKRTSEFDEASDASEQTPLMSSNDSASPGYVSVNNSSSDSSSKVSYLRSPIWWFGILLMTGGELCNFLSYGFAPASLVAPLGTVALISNCAVAPLLLGEQFFKSDIFGVVLAILGTITIVLSTPRSTQAFSPAQLQEALSQVTFIVYVSLCLVAVVVLVILSSSRYAERFIVIDVGLCAILGGFTVLSTKALSSLLNQMFLACFKYPVSWLVTAVLVITAVTQVVFLNRALQRFDSKHVVPVQFVLFTIIAIVGSAILYQDFKNVTSAQALNFFFGCLFIFTGVYILTWNNDESDKHNAESTTAQPQQESATAYIRGTSLPRAPLSSVSEEDVIALDNDLPERSDHHITHSIFIPTQRLSSVPVPELRRRRSQPILVPRAFGTPGYYLIAATTASIKPRAKSWFSKSAGHVDPMSRFDHHP